MFREEHHEEYIEVRNRTDGRLVTILDVVSPLNKTCGEGRGAYLEKRREARAAERQHRRDRPGHAGPADARLLARRSAGMGLRRHRDRCTQPEGYEIYTSTLQKRLPRFKLPLAVDDRDTVVDLQAAFARCYDQGAFAAQLDYQQPAPAVTAEDDRRWVHDLLVQLKLCARNRRSQKSEDMMVGLPFMSFTKPNEFHRGAPGNERNAVDF